jgi:hypothetical protein
LFSDDDIMDPTAIKTMFNVIKKETPWLILNKFLWFTDENALKKRKSPTIGGNITSVVWIKGLFEYC